MSRAALLHYNGAVGTIRWRRQCNTMTTSIYLGGTAHWRRWYSTMATTECVWNRVWVSALRSRDACRLLRDVLSR